MSDQVWLAIIALWMPTVTAVLAYLHFKAANQSAAQHAATAAAIAQLHVTVAAGAKPALKPIPKGTNGGG